MDDAVRTFLETNHAAAMTTLKRDGTPHTVRIGVALVAGKIWSSGTQDRLRTKHLRRDPRSTLFVFNDTWAYLTLECRVAILEGPAAIADSVKLFETMQRGMTPAPSPGKLVWYGQEKSVDEFLKLMEEERRIIYQFDVTRSYGLYGAAPAR